MVEIEQKMEQVCPACETPHGLNDRSCIVCQFVFVSPPFKPDTISTPSSTTLSTATSTISSTTTATSKPRKRKRDSTATSSSDKQSKSSSSSSHHPHNDELDGFSNTCGVCHDTGKLLCCDGCMSAYHMDCVGIDHIPSGEWHCPQCKLKEAKQSGAVDSHVDQFMDTYHVDAAQRECVQRLDLNAQETVDCQGITYIMFPELKAEAV